MQREGFLLAAGAAFLACGAAHAAEVAVCTDHGRFVIELADREAPKQVANFLRYVDMSFYSGTVIHRVMPGFVVQGGGLDRKLLGRPTLAPVANESKNGLRNERGSVAAARGQGADTATSQFFVNLEDNPSLDDAHGLGYTVFGRVTQGIQVVDAISRLPTGAMGPLKDSVPMPLVVILSIARLDEDAVATLPEAGREAALEQLIEKAAAAGDYDATRHWIGLYRAACAPPEPKMAVAEARAALAANDRTRARFVLEEYFAVTDHDDPTYEDAVALYRTAVPEQAAAEPGDASPTPAQQIGDCKTPATPEIPDGARATAEQMVTAQGRVKAFVTEGQAYVKCVDAVADDKDRATPDRNAAIVEHNRMVGELEHAAGGFNEQVRTFKARK
jgi:cyclophilin family peptidyl-prolyl cis-trans isomerase